MIKKIKFTFKAQDATMNKIHVAMRLGLVNGKDDLLDDINEGNIHREVMLEDFPYENCSFLAQLHIKYLHWDFYTADTGQEVKSKVEKWWSEKESKALDTWEVIVQSTRIDVKPLKRVAYAETKIFYADSIRDIVDLSFVEDNFPYVIAGVKLISDNVIRVIFETNDVPEQAESVVRIWVSQNKPKIVVDDLATYQRVHTSVEDVTEPREHVLGKGYYLYYYSTNHLVY
jgi:hypothetical protein